MIYRTVALLSLLIADSASSFQTPSIFGRSYPGRQSETALSSSYLDSLSLPAKSSDTKYAPAKLSDTKEVLPKLKEDVQNVPQSKTTSPPSYLDSLNGGVEEKTINLVEEEVMPPVVVGPEPFVESIIEGTNQKIYFPPFAHANLAYFDLEEMRSKGPRPVFDWGTPEDFTRKLGEAGKLSVGAWFCTEGGWNSPKAKAATEIFYVLSGNGCLQDDDGEKHYFGPGDTVIIPKGHQGRWDVFEPIHKIWAVNSHDEIEDQKSSVVVAKYHNFAPQYLEDLIDPLSGGYPIDAASTVIYSVGPTEVGIWTCDSPVTIDCAPFLTPMFFHVLEGVICISDYATGYARRCVPGDTVLLPEGWCGTMDIIQPVKKLWTTAASVRPREKKSIEWLP